MRSLWSGVRSGHTGGQLPSWAQSTVGLGSGNVVYCPSRFQAGHTNSTCPDRPHRLSPTSYVLLPKRSNGKVSSSSFPPLFISDRQTLSRSSEKPHTRQASDSSLATNHWNPEQQAKETRRSVKEKKKGGTVPAEEQ